MTIILKLNGQIDLSDIKPEDIDIQDIVMALPHICRFGGRCHSHYSVAQHSVELAKYFIKKKRLDLARIAILHDACEAFIGDIIYPIKLQLPYFEKVEKELSSLIFKRFGVDESSYKEFYPFDRRISVNEAKALGIWESCKSTPTMCYLTEIEGVNIIPMSIKEARKEFIEMLIRVGVVKRNEFN